MFGNNGGCGCGSTSSSIKCRRNKTGITEEGQQKQTEVEINGIGRFCTSVGIAVLSLTQEIYVRWISSYSVCCLSDGRSKASSKTIPPHSAIQSLLFQMSVSSPVLKVIQQLLTSSSSSSCHIHLSLYLSFNNLFQKAVST